MASTTQIEQRSSVSSSPIVSQNITTSANTEEHGSTANGDHEDISELRKQEIGDILQQIMNITDQSLDEAQARCVFQFT